MYIFIFILAANEYAKKSSKIYRTIGYNSLEEGAFDSAINYFEKAAENEKYLDVHYDYDMSKNLQGMALAYTEKGYYEKAKPLIEKAVENVERYIVFWFRTRGIDSL